MNAHALAATHTRPPAEPGGREAWIAHTAAVTLAWSALVTTIGSEVEP